MKVTETQTIQGFSDPQHDGTSDNAFTTFCSSSPLHVSLFFFFFLNERHLSLSPHHVVSFSSTAVSLSKKLSV